MRCYAVKSKGLLGRLPNTQVMPITTNRKFTRNAAFRPSSTKPGGGVGVRREIYLMDGYRYTVFNQSTQI